MHLHGSSHEAHLPAFHPKTLTPRPHRAMSYILQNLTPRTGTPSSPFLESVFQRAQQLCEDQRPLQSGALTELPHFTCYENRLAQDGDYRHFTGDGQFTEHEDLRVRPLSFHQSIMGSTYDSAESIARSPESDLDDKQLRALLASPLYLQEREASAERSQVFYSERENLMSSSSQDPISTGKPVASISSQNRLNPETFSDREDFSLRYQQFFLGSNEPFIRFSNPANVVKSLRDGGRDHFLAEARSELMKQEYKVESLDTCMSELQQQTYAQRLELEDAHHGYVESRREQVRPQKN